MLARLISAGLVIAAATSAATADGNKINFRGGIAGAHGGYSYAFDSNVSSSPIIPIEASYGFGIFSEISYHPATVLGFQDVEFLSSLVVSGGSGSHGDFSGGAICSPFSLTDLISLSHSLCMNGAETKSATLIFQSHGAVLRPTRREDTEMILGLGGLAVGSVSAGSMFFPGENSEQNRFSGFSGLGLIAGVRQSRELGKFELTSRALLGLYYGKRRLEISDLYDGAGLVEGDLSSTVSDFAGALDVTISIAKPTQVAGRAASLEFGINHKILVDVLDTANYNTSSGATGASSPSGSTEDMISVTSLFSAPLSSFKKNRGRLIAESALF